MHISHKHSLSCGLNVQKETTSFLDVYLYLRTCRSLKLLNQLDLFDVSVSFFLGVTGDRLGRL